MIADRIVAYLFSFWQNELASLPGGEMTTSYHPGYIGVCQFNRQLLSENE